LNTHWKNIINIREVMTRKNRLVETQRAIVKEKRTFKEVQQDLTELNGDGNRTRGRYGEDNEKVVEDLGEVSRREGRRD